MEGGQESYFLEEEFKRHFKFQSNVNLDISFQRYDPEWEEYVDLEPGSTICHKEKLKAVVTPILVSAAASTAGTGTSSVR